MIQPANLNDIRNIAISGRIASGASTLADHLAKKLHWQCLKGGELFRQYTNEHNLSLVNSETRPDEFDLGYEEKVKNLLRNETHQVVESHLAGFNSQGIENIFKILVICEDEKGADKTDIRVDRLMNRDKVPVDFAKHEVLERENKNLEKWRRLYANNDSTWYYWDKKYYDLVINTYSHNTEESLQIVLKGIGYR